MNRRPAGQSSSTIDTKRLEEIVRTNIETLCRDFFPEGRKEGGEWKIADVTGAKGRSLGIQLIGPKAGLSHDRATGEGRGFVKLVMENRGVTFLEVCELIERALGVNLHGPIEPFGNHLWQECVQRMTPAKRKELCAYRGYSPDFVDWLVASSLIGIFKDKHAIERWAFPFQHEGRVAAIHCEIQKDEQGRKRWFYFPKLSDLGLKVAPFVLGDLSNAAEVHIHESQWDLLAQADIIGFDSENQGIALIATLGANNGAMAGVVNKLESKNYLWPQRDIPDENGKVAARAWLEQVRTTIRRPAYVCWIPDLKPERSFDFNDWRKQADVSPDDIAQIMRSAERKSSFAAGQGDDKSKNDESRKDALREKYQDFKSKPLADAVDTLPSVLIEGILFQTRRMLILGASKGHKTWLCSLIAFCISKGLPLFGRFETEKSLVIFANLELLEGSAKARFKAIADGLGYKGDPFENLRIISACEHLDKIQNDFSEFLALQAADDHAQVVFIDPMWRLLGEYDENSNTAIGQVLKPFARFSREAHASSVGSHHFAKGDPAGKEAIDRGAGAGAWARDAATIMVLSKHREPGAYIIDIETNDFARIEKFCVRFTHPVLELAPDLNPDDLKVSSSRVRAAGAKKSANQAETILAVLYTSDQEGGLTHGEICHFTTYPKSSVTKILKQLISAGKVVKLVASEVARYALSSQYREKMDQQSASDL